MSIVDIVFPVFAVAFIGYLLAYKGVFSTKDIAGITRFVFKIAIPVLLFDSLAHLELPETPPWAFWASYYLPVFVVFGTALLLGRVLFHYSAREQGVFSMGASFSNLMLVGLPILSGGLGDAVLLPLFIIVSIHSATLFFLGTITAERGNGEQSLGEQLRHTFGNLARNTIVMGLVLGLLVNVTGLVLPTAIESTLEILGRSALPCALFVLGASLSQFRLGGEMLPALIQVGLKLLLLPALVAVLAFGVFDLDPLWATVAVMAAAMPCGVNTYMFAEMNEVYVPQMASAVLLSTLFSIVTLSGMLWYFI